MIFDDITFGVPDDSRAPVEGVRQVTTSDALSSKAKIFLLENNIRITNFKKKDMRIISNVLQDLELPTPGVQIRIRTQQQINLISMILKIVEVHGVVDELVIATYTLNRIALDTLSDLITSKKILKTKLLIASSYSFRDRKYYQHLKDTCLSLNKTGHDVKLTFAWSHFKITLVKCGTDHYQFEGSMNYSTNNMAENLLFENSESTYNHDFRFIVGVMQEVNNKALETVC